MQYHIVKNGQAVGPFSIDQLIAQGVTPDTLVWVEGMTEWKPASAFPEIMMVLNTNTAYSQPQPPQPPYYQAQAQYQQPYQQPQYAPQPGGNMVPSSGKDKNTAGILALLLGFLGIHYFYVGKTGGGLICILLVLITCGVWEIITFIQGIIILCMTQQDFDRKWVYNNSTFPVFP